ncbi:MAG: hypothetical protein ACI39E_05860 [Acutalibacteraceae bacterium]
MKKCPFCKAEIEENARFCLYCMTSLEDKQIIDAPAEKKKRWLYIPAAVLVLLLAVVCTWLFAKGDGDPSSSKEPPLSSSIGDTVTSESGFDAENTTAAPTFEDGAAGTNPDSSPSVSNADVSDTAVTYTYREATVDDCYPPGKGSMYVSDNIVVITGVVNPAPDGVYTIPETIDGNKVAAIMPSAFCDANISQTVRTVILPATVRTVWSDAFGDCCNLTDIYIKSLVIGIYEDAFPELPERTEALTIHCAKDCRNFDFYYYRNIASDYGAVYEEWNG